MQHSLFIALTLKRTDTPGLASGQMDTTNVQGQEYIALGVALVGQKHTFLIRAAIVANAITVL